MNAVVTFKKIIAVAAGTTAVALAGSGCTVVTAGVSMPDKSAVGQPASVIDSSACAQVDAPKVEIPTVSADEPRLRIPQPYGWESTTLSDYFGIDKESLRFTLVNSPSVFAEDNIALVGIREVPVSEPEAIFEEGRARMVEAIEALGVQADMTMTASTLCGLPARKYTLEISASSTGAAPEGTSAAGNYLHVLAEIGGRTYLVVVIMVGTNDIPAYQRDAETILTGFEVLPSASASI